MVRLDLQQLQVGRAAAFAHLRSRGIGANVHYAPVYWHSYYKSRGYARGLCPVAEHVYEELLTLPMFPAMTERDVERVVDAVREIARL